MNTMDVNDTFFELIDKVNNALENVPEISARKYALDLITNQKNYSLEKIPKNELKNKIRLKKEEWLDNLPELIEKAKQGLISVGCEVYYARTPSEALQYITKILPKAPLQSMSKDDQLIFRLTFHRKHTPLKV